MYIFLQYSLAHSQYILLFSCCLYVWWFPLKLKLDLFEFTIEGVYCSIDGFSPCIYELYDIYLNGARFSITSYYILVDPEPKYMCCNALFADILFDGSF